jgi:UDP-2-acetamido-3-amino-2,3-dideoxy-glucuronate N-acetyltransferase
VVLTNVINPRSAIERKNQFQKTLIKRGASIGANATIICGNTIGEFAFIGAATVITKDVLPYALMVGNPGRQKGWMSEFGHRLIFDENQKAICPESHQEYILENGQVKRIK